MPYYLWRMNYQETLEYLFSRLPMFHRIGAAAYKANLDNTLRICEYLGNPEREFRSLHIAGTNGKGSVSHLLASILQEAGYKTGLYTSPHLKDFRERIRINGKKIPAPYITRFVRDHKAAFEQVDPSFFEYSVGLAFRYFADEKVDIAVLETGLGGRLDSTNVVMPVMSVITNISKDHMAFLGDSLEEIAAEKAGIIKPGIPAVIGERQEETEAVFIAKAREAGAPLFFAEDHIILDPALPGSPRQWPSYPYKIKSNGASGVLHCPLYGHYQVKNLVTVLMSVDVLRHQGFLIDQASLERGVSKVIVNTALLGRWQVLGNRPRIICDVGHNEAGIRAILDQLAGENYKKLHWVLGVVSDKDTATILKMLPEDAIYYFCKAAIPRGLDADRLQEMAAAVGLKGSSYLSVKEAFSAARNAASAQDLVMVAGSTFTVAEVL